MINLCVQVDRRQAQRWGFDTLRAADGAIVSLIEPRELCALVVEANPLRDDWALDDSLATRRTVMWSGSLADDLFESHPANWMRAGHGAFNQLCDQLRPQLEAGGGRVTFRPHCRHILSDPQSCMQFLLDREGQPFGIALSPADLLEPSMLNEIDEHLQRAFESIGPRCDMLLLHDVRLNQEGDQLDPAPLGQGVLPREHVTRLLCRCIAAQTRVIIQYESLEAQIDWLGAV